MTGFEELHLQGSKSFSPSLVALEPGSESKLLFGQQAQDVVNANERAPHLINWKEYVGMTHDEISEALLGSEDKSAEEFFRHIAIEQLLEGYFLYVKNGIAERFGPDNLPRLVVGYPPLETQNRAWAKRYRQRVKEAFRAISLADPVIFPEPFAVFQYHRKNGSLPTSAGEQNILVVDIGGGISSSCVIRTTTIGRLAVSSYKCLPLGVESTQAAGSLIDKLMVERILGADKTRSQVALGRMVGVKEQITNKVNVSPRAWSSLDPEISSQLVYNNKSYPVTSLDLQAVVQTVWNKHLSDMVQRTVSSVLAESGVIDHVILSGGSSTIGLFEQLLRSQLGDRLSGKIVISAEQRETVSRGLAVEAAESAGRYEIAGSNDASIAPYVAEDLAFVLNRDGAKTEHSLRPKAVPNQPANPEGILLSAPIMLQNISGRKYRWALELPHEVPGKSLEFVVSLGDPARKLRGKIPYKREDAVVPRKSYVTLEIDDLNLRGTLSLEIVDPAQTQRAKKEMVSADKLLDIDFGAFCEHQRGSKYIGLDFGTSKTSISTLSQTAVDRSPMEKQFNRNPACIAYAKQVTARLLEFPHDIASLRKYCSAVRVRYVCESNAIEGNALNRGQTQMVLENAHKGTEGVKAGLGTYIDGEFRVLGPVVKDIREAENLGAAFDYATATALDYDSQLTELFIRELNQLALTNVQDAEKGRYRTHNVGVYGDSANEETITYRSPDHFRVPELMREFVAWFNGSHESTNPVIFAAEAHMRFVEIHPFADGNGRVARLLVHFSLLRRRLPSLLLQKSDRHRYYDALENGNNEDLSDLIALFCEGIEEQLEIFKISGIVKPNIPEHSVSAVASAHAIDPDPLNAVINNLLKEDSAQLARIRIYEQWARTFSAFREQLEGLVSGFNQRVSLATTPIRFQIKNYDLVDEATFHDIADGRKFRKTWFMQAVYAHGKSAASVIFYFHHASKALKGIPGASTIPVTLSLSIYKDYNYKSISNIEIFRNVEIFLSDDERLYILKRQQKGAAPTAQVADSRRLLGELIEDLEIYFSQGEPTGKPSAH